MHKPLALASAHLTLSSKADTESADRTQIAAVWDMWMLCLYRSREENLAKARAFRAAGNLAAANEHYQRAVDICPAVAKQFMEVCSLASAAICRFRDTTMVRVLLPLSS